MLINKKHLRREKKRGKIYISVGRKRKEEKRKKEKDVDIFNKSE